MSNQITTAPLNASPSQRLLPISWQRKGIASLRIIFGLIWCVAAWLKWQPAFQSSFIDQVSGAKDGQPVLIQEWITLWASLINMSPLLFARVEAATETALALCLLLGLFSNLTYIVGILLSLGIWSTAEGFGGPYMPGHSTDVGTALPYAVLFAILLSIGAGRYYSLDRWLSSRLGRFSFLAAGPAR